MAKTRRQSSHRRKSRNRRGRNRMRGGDKPIIEIIEDHINDEKTHREHRKEFEKLLIEAKSNEERIRTKIERILDMGVSAFSHDPESMSRPMSSSSSTSKR